MCGESQSPKRADPFDSWPNSWLREADDRMKAFHEGKIEAMNGPEVLAELRGKYTRKNWLEKQFIQASFLPRLPARK
jgi:hypothetical protein